MEYLGTDEYDSVEEIPWRSKSWRKYAKCSGHDTETFYPPRNRDLYKSIADESKSVCKGRDGFGECLARVQCLTYAIKTDEPHGIWGGLSHRERNALMRKWIDDGRPELVGYITEYIREFKS